MEVEKVLYAILLKSPTNLWDAFEEECRKFYDQPAHSLTEMRTRDNKKVRGDIFEEFCVLYLKHVRGFDEVWRLQDVPDEILAKLGMKRVDMGIDIVARKGDNFSAVQCKYKKHTSAKINMVTWKALATFYGLCLRTGPWNKYIVMTNCSYVRHQGAKTAKDLSICMGTLRNTTKEQWMQMCNLEANTVSSDAPAKTIDEIRAARLSFFLRKE